MEESRHTTGNKKVVPWLSMNEFEQVYKQIFSSNTEEQVKGLEQLLMWRARCLQGIPKGARCTIDLLQVCLKDRELWPQIANGTVPAYHESYLQSIYSMAVMRFLNYLEPNYVTRRLNPVTYSGLLNKLEMPEWLGDVRNATAHYHTWAPLSVLRGGIQYCLTWLHEHYWKKEAELTADLVVDKKIKNSGELAHLLESFQALMLYSKAGISKYNEIPDMTLRQMLLDLRDDCDLMEVDGMRKHLKNSGHILEKNDVEEARLLVIKKLIYCVPLHNAHSISQLVDMLLENDGFLPTPDFLSVFNTSYDQWRLKTDNLPLHFIFLWMSLLEFLPQYQMVPILLKKLVQLTSNEDENSHRRRMAALWTKELALSLHKVKRMKYMDRQLPTKEDKRWFSLTVLEAVEEQDPSLKQISTLKMTNLPKSVTELSLLSKVLDKPSKWTPIFLPSVLDLMDPPLSKNAVQKITSLVNIHTQGESSEKEKDDNINSPVYTVSNLKKANGVGNEKPVENCNKNIPRDFKTDWVRCEGGMEWKWCPLGMLPWQQGKDSLHTELVCNIEWHPAKLPGDKPVEIKFPGLFQEKVNLGEVRRKRPSLAKNIVPVPVDNTKIRAVKRAFDVAIGIK